MLRGKEKSVRLKEKEKKLGNRQERREMSFLEDFLRARQDFS